MKKTMMMLAFASGVLTVSAQVEQPQQTYLNESHSDYIPVFQYWKEHDILQHLDVSVTGGTTGIGIEVASPIGKYFQVRAGYEFMPRFTKTLDFDLTIGGMPARQYDSNGYRVETRFDKMAGLLYNMTGYDIEDHVDMAGKPTMNNAKLLVDFFPLKNNKHWHVTAGVYWGPSKFAIADNTTEAMVSLLSVGMYNRMYDHALNNDPFSEWMDMKSLGLSQDALETYEGVIPTAIYDKFKDFGRLGFGLGTLKRDIYGRFTEDVYDDHYNLIHEKGEYGVLHAAGETYNMEPGSDGMVHVTAKSKALKPYLGFGYTGRLMKQRDDWQVGFDAGVWFWGGTPDLYTHEGINLTKDVENIGGQVGDYVDLFKAFKVYPALSVRFTKRIF